jgi:predicted acetyltransferase
VHVEFRPVEAAEVPAFARAAAVGFGERPTYAEEHPRWVSLDLDRTRAGFDGEDLVATSRNYSLELSLPGGAVLPAAGVSAVTVRPTHRRRGLLRSIMDELLDEATTRGEAVAMLTASEGSIYERFGFGITTRSMAIELDRRDVEFVRPRPEGQLRLLDADEATKLEPDVFERVRRSYPGAVSRPDAWWSDEQWDPRFGVRFDVAYEAGGVVAGFACYGLRESFDPSSGAGSRLVVRDLVAGDPAALHGLWRYLCEVDLVRTISDPGAPLDLPLPWWLASNRAVRVRGVKDAVWTRLLDVPAALGARTYAGEGRLTLGVRDESRPGGRADGTFTLDAGRDGAAVRAGGRPDLECSVSAVSAAWLGGVRWTTLAAAGLVEERTDQALARADQLFACDPLPFPFTWF